MKGKDSRYTYMIFALICLIVFNLGTILINAMGNKVSSVEEDNINRQGGGNPYQVHSGDYKLDDAAHRWRHGKKDEVGEILPDNPVAILNQKHRRVKDDRKADSQQDKDKTSPAVDVVLIKYKVDIGKNAGHG